MKRNKDINENIRQVHKEAVQILKNIDKVRGQKYGAAVQSLLLIHQIAEIGALLCEEVGKDHPQLQEAASKGLMHSLYDIGLNLQHLAEFDGDTWASICIDADSASSTISRLLKGALRAHAGGKSFGDSSNAH